MDFTYKDWRVIISSDKKNIILDKNFVDLDGILIDMPGEYEKSWFLMYVKKSDNIMYFHFRVEWNWIAYIPEIPKDIDSKILDFFGQLDILIAPFSKSEQKLIENIEPRMIVSFSEKSSDLIPLLGEPVSNSNSYKLKMQDISVDKTSLVILQ